jgi:hypothetical protein
MSNNQAQPQLTPQQQAAVQQDHLVKMLVEDLPRDRARIRRINPSDTKRLRDELDGTAMSYIQDALQYQIRIRNWTAEELTEVHRVIGSLHERLTDLEESQGDGGDSGLDPEEYDNLVKLCGGTKALVEMIQQLAAALKRGDKVEISDEQLGVVTAQGTLADGCLSALSSYEVSGGDEGDEGDDEQEEDSGG